jgi:putative colanic acid biosynthesis acetyltransferase WcaF
MRVRLLRMFGAKIGNGVVIKPRVTVKFPWRLSVGDYAWIGEGVWIDNLANVSIGEQCCLSQGAYVCTGSHDWTSPRFELITKPVTIEPEAWICARATISPGVCIGRGAVVGLGVVITQDVAPWSIFKSSAAQKILKRVLIDHDGVGTARKGQ